MDGSVESKIIVWLIWSDKPFRNKRGANMVPKTLDGALYWLPLILSIIVCTYLAVYMDPEKLNNGFFSEVTYNFIQSSD